MRPRHIFEIDRLSVLIEPHRPVARVVTEAILYTDDDPTIELDWTRDISAETIPDCAHHRFVKTTPKPSATKKRSGDEFWPCCGGGVLPLAGLVSVEDGDAETDVEPILDVGVPEIVDDTGAPVEMADGKSVFVPVVTACLTTIRAPSTKAWLRRAISSTCNCVGFAKNRYDGYHGLAMCCVD